MKNIKKHIILFLILLLPIALFIHGCGDEDENAFVFGPGGNEAQSEDGRIIVNVPPGALNENTEISFNIISEDEDQLVVELLPEGLQFNIPITITVETGVRLNEVFPLVELISGNSTELIDNLELNENVSGTYSITADLEHFTDFSIQKLSIPGSNPRRSLVQVAFQNPPRILENGDIFNENVSLSIFTNQVNLSDATIFMDNLAPIACTPDFIAPNGDQVVDLPLPDNIEQISTANIQCGCAGVGLGALRLNVRLTGNVTEPFGDIEVLNLNNYEFVFQRTIECIDQSIGDDDDDDSTPGDDDDDIPPPPPPSGDDDDDDQCTPTTGQENGETTCTDGIDNDCDGESDCADTDCDTAFDCACFTGGNELACEFDLVVCCNDQRCANDPACDDPPPPPPPPNMDGVCDTSGSGFNARNLNPVCTEPNPDPDCLNSGVCNEGFCNIFSPNIPSNPQTDCSCCNDNADNDQDGDIDTADPDCASCMGASNDFIATCEITELDSNGDATVIVTVTETGSVDVGACIIQSGLIVNEDGVTQTVGQIAFFGPFPDPTQTRQVNFRQLPTDSATLDASFVVDCSRLDPVEIQTEQAACTFTVP